MKDICITKLYAGLTDKERAALTFDYLMQGNELECNRIQASMPEQYYIGLPLEYRRSLDSLTMIASLYAIEYWRSVALAYMFRVGHRAVFSYLMEKYTTNSQRVQSPEWQESENLLKLFQRYEVMVLSIEKAVDELCADHGINQAAIRKMAGERNYEVIGTPPDQPDLEPDASIVADLRRGWEGLLM